MLKKMTSIMITLMLFCQLFASAKPYIEDKNEYVLNDTGKTIQAIAEDVPVDINASGGPLVISFSAASNVSVSMVTDSESFQFFQYLAGGRGPILRENKIAVFMYAADGTKIQWGSDTKNFTFELDMTKGTIKTKVDGTYVSYSSTEANYTAKESCTFSGTIVKSLLLSGGAFRDLKVFYLPEKTGSVQYKDDEYKLHYEALDRLGAITSAFASTDMEDSITRAQFATITARLIGIHEDSFSGDSLFTDVRKSNSAYSYINELGVRGYMTGENGKFRPSAKITLEEAIAAIGSVMGYNVPAKAQDVEMKGSLPRYMGISEMRQLLKKITVKDGNQLVSMKDAACILYESLTIPFYSRVSFGSEEKYDNQDEENCILKVYHGYMQYEGRVIKTDAEKNRILVDIKDGGSNWYSLNKDLSILNLIGTQKYFWINANNEIGYFYDYKFSKALYGFVSSYNKDQTEGAVNTEDIGKIELANYDGSIETGNNFTVMQNGTVINGTVELCGKFVRIDTVDNNAVNLCILGEAIEGGLVNYLSQEKITFQKGDSKEVIEDEISGNVITLLDGVEVSYDKIGNGMYFDYLKDGDYTYLLFSDKTYSGVLSEVSSEYITVDDMEHKLTAQTLYMSTDKELSYSADMDINKLLDENVKVYTDMSGVVRYVAGTLATEFYGVVIGGETKFGGSEKYLAVAAADNGKTVKTMVPYESKKETLYYPEVSYEEALSNQKDPNGMGVYKFFVSGGKIRKIEKIDWKYSAFLTTGESINKSYNYVESSDDSTKLTFIHPDATVIMLFNEKGEFEPSIFSFSALKAGKVTGYDDFSFNVNNIVPMAELLVLGEGSENLYDSTWYYGLVTNISKLYQNEECYYKYVIQYPLGKQEFTTPVDTPLSVAGQKAEKMDVILYSFNGAFKSAMQPLNTRKLSVLDPNLVKYSYQTTDQSDEGTVSYTRDFFIAGTFLQESSGFIEVSFEGKDIWYRKNASCSYLKVGKDSKTSLATANDLIGKKIYMATYEGLTQLIIGVE